MSALNLPLANGPARRSATAAVGVFLLLVGLDLALLLRMNGGALVFPLDDPMIHLALARQIAHGHYGINAGEASSPSSSILWPFLMAIAGRSRWLPWWALAGNAACGAAAAWVLGTLADELPGELGRGARRMLAVMMVFVANLAGLTLLGMEHTLQVLLCAVCGLGLTRVLAGRELPWWAVAAAVLAPSVRYEDLAVTLTVAVALWATRRRGSALGTLAAAVFPIGAFAVFLHRLGLPWLPLSVLAKGGPLLGGGPFHGGDPAVRETIFSFDRMVVLGLLAGLVYATMRTRERRTRAVLGGVSGAALLQLLVGPFGWFHRYEIYLVTVAVMVLLWSAARGLRGTGFVWAAAGMALTAKASFTSAMVIPWAAHSVYLQQYQMGRFVREFHGGNVAVNDLGWVAYEKRPAQYVFDLVGLGSLEANQEKAKSAAWMERMMGEHGIRLVMRYPSMRRLAPAPPSWQDMGSLAAHPRYTPAAFNCVIFYATAEASPKEVEELRGEIGAFAAQLPEGAFWSPPGRCGERDTGPRGLRDLLSRR